VSRRDFDVVIVGGGMVGAGCAALLATELPRLRIALLEPRPVTMRSGELDLRVSALSRASQRLLERVGAWSAVLARGACAYERMVVWDEAAAPDALGSIHFDAASLGEPDLGHITENLSVQAALQQRAVACGITLLRTQLAALDLGPEAARFTTDDGRTHAAGLIVAADGADSPARSLAGISTKGHPYDQHAVVAHLRPERSHAHTAWQRFLATGPLALLPLADGRVSLVWSTQPAHAAELAAADDAAFGAAVTQASAGVLGSLQAASVRASFPLRLLHAHDYTRPRFVLIGDAAHAVHPLAGQGVNLGLLDAGTLVEVLADATRAGLDPGEVRVLRRYERWRKTENLKAIAAMDGLKRIFALSPPGFPALRRIGISLVDRSDALKGSLMRRAMGLAGDLPALLAADPRR
jgi:2-octaprenylphenol hydroxylase